ncbi:auxin efflux carrier [Russula earlei]|uniref:Auxin efflux carrier n=1 Tax=Russula earlei TaxID=71964 RepID=A0ACC0TX25_9AGAM|nr:auxin efflux carrier [Russula earlei]
MVSTGSLVWTSIRPLLRTFLNVGAGFALTKANVFPPQAARGCAQIALNIALPCLVFSRIVPAFTPQNINALAPLTVVGLLYGIAGVVMAWAIRQAFWVPHRFRYGILAAGGWANYGDIPTAIAMGMTASAPFNGVDDENSAIAYISAFLLLFYITLFPLGGFLIIAKDFEGSDVESEDLRERMHLRRQRMVANATRSLRRLSHLSGHSENTCDTEAGADLKTKDTISDETAKGDASVDQRVFEVMQPPPPIAPESRRTVCSRLRHFSAELIKPAPIVIVLSIVIALVNPLKALFVLPSAGFQPRFRPTAPDGQPPLAFVLDTATFVGAAGVPLGLICLGSALALLRVRSGEPFPRGAIAALTLAKMVVTPVLGVAITRFFVRVGFVNRDDKVLQFLCILFSGVPSATTQVYLTQIYSPGGSVEHLSAFLIPQYVLLPFTMTGLVAYTLHYLF